MIRVWWKLEGERKEEKRSFVTRENECAKVFSLSLSFHVRYSFPTTFISSNSSRSPHKSVFSPRYGSNTHITTNGTKKCHINYFNQDFLRSFRDVCLTFATEQKYASVIFLFLASHSLIMKGEITTLFLQISRVIRVTENSTQSC